MDISSRERALERGIERLEGRLGRLEALSRRYSWYRLGVIVLGVFFTWLAAERLGSSWGWGTAALFALIWLAVTLAHSRVDLWIEKFHIQQGIKAQQLARLRLDWETIPDPPLFAGRPVSSLEVDLDLTGRRSLHQLLDIAISRQGSQLLADWLSDPDPDPQRVAEHQHCVRELVPMVKFRDRLLLTFRLASKENLEGDRLLRWLGEEVSYDRLSRSLTISIYWVAINIGLFLLNSFGLAPPYWIATLVLYMIFYLSNSFGPFFEAVVHLDSELDKFRTVLRYLERAPLGGRESLAGLLAPLRSVDKAPSARLRKVKWITAGAGMRMNPVAGLLLNLVLPWDFLFAYWAAKARTEIADRLPEWFRTLYTLEAFVSLSNFAYLNPDYTFPEVVPDAEPVFQAERIGHPLLPAAKKVSNDVRVEALGHITLITGSNMAGKSTFIKTIGVNLCLACAGGPVDAVRFRTQPFRLHSCIRISDSITDGFSYFYAEVKCLKSLLEWLDSEGWPVLYLVDEIFRGTNNRERLIGSRAYLRRLVGERGIGFLATHDLELAGLAEESPAVRNFHFRDEVRDGRLVFDYRLRPGASPTTNALKIMRLEGLPVDESPEK